MKLETINFEEGVEKLLKITLKHKNKPLLVGIFGHPNSGKTELRIKTRDKLYKTGKFGWIGMNRDSLDRYPGEKKDIEYYLIEDIGAPICAERYALENFGKKLDLKIYMAQNFNPEASLPWKDLKNNVYDLIIENPKANNKRKYSDTSKF